jgi:polar amino acid transport system substrate-binding protein
MLVATFVALAPLCLAACGNDGSILLGPKGRQITVAVGQEDYPPFNLTVPGTGERVGWDYDTVREICRRLNCMPEFQPAPFEGVFEALHAGAFDMLAAGVTVTEERKQLVEFSVSYAAVTEVLAVRASDPSSLDEFKADGTKLVGVLEQTTNEATARMSFPAERIRTFGDNTTALALALLNGDVDGVVLDSVVVNQFTEEPGAIRIVASLTPEKDLAFAFPPGSDLVGAVNSALEAMMRDGTLESLNRQWNLIP